MYEDNLTEGTILILILSTVWVLGTRGRLKRIDPAHRVIEIPIGIVIHSVSPKQCNWCITVHCHDGIALPFEPFFGNCNFHCDGSMILCDLSSLRKVSAFFHERLMQNLHCSAHTVMESYFIDCNKSKKSTGLMFNSLKLLEICALSHFWIASGNGVPRWQRTNTSIIRSVKCGGHVQSWQSLLLSLFGEVPHQDLL